MDPVKSGMTNFAAGLKVDDRGEGFELADPFLEVRHLDHVAGRAARVAAGAAG